jgi:outer membrane protein assembly factor BamE
VFSPYRPDIQQGNFVSQEMLGQLKVGQSRDQVKFILGTPLLTDAFHADRWDYPFYLARGNGELTTSRVTVYFKDNLVARIDGGNLPTEREYISRLIGISKYETKTEQESLDELKRKREEAAKGGKE